MTVRAPHDPVIMAALGGGAARAGKGAPPFAVELEAAALLRMGSPGAPVAERLARYFDPTLVLIKGVLLPLVLEDGQEGRHNTMRGLFDVYSRPSKDYPTGVEPLRTDRTDSAGPGRTVVDIVQNHFGFMARIWKVKEERRDSPGRVARVAIWVDILGPPTDEEREEAETAWGQPIPKVTQENRLSGQHRPAAPARTHAPAPAPKPASSRQAQAGERVAPRPAPASSPLSAEDRIALEAGDRAAASIGSPKPVPPPAPAGPTPPPPPPVDDGIPLGAPGVFSLPEAKMAAYIDPTDPPLQWETSKIAAHAMRLTNGDSPRDGETQSAAHDRMAHELVEALLGYSLYDPAKDNGKARDGTPHPPGGLSFDLIRSRYHAAQLLAHLTKQPSPPKVEALT